MVMVELHIALPDWAASMADRAPAVFATMEDKMRFVIELARNNVKHGLGGPFGAAVFTETGELLSVGVNQVMVAQCSILHAEIMALALAQKRLGSYDLSQDGRLRHDLYASTEPCAMCFGAIPWAGVTGLVCAARDEDARMIGFEEGAKLRDWVGALHARGIKVQRDVLREEAKAVLRDYAAAGGKIYNSKGTAS